MTAVLDRVVHVVLALLVFDALLTLVLEVLFLPLYVGSIAFPISAVLAAVVNVLLILGARTVTDRTGLQSLPLIAWCLGFVVLLFGGPGGDVLLAPIWQTLLLLIMGIAAPAWALGAIAFKRVAAIQPAR